MSAQGQSSGGTSNGAATGNAYNPQPMPGYTGQSNYTGVPQGWDMTIGSAPSNGNWNGANYAQGVASMPTGTPDWLKSAMGNYYAQPMQTDPTQYGRWNWGQNLQGGGPPSAFGQYAQQTAQYPSLQYPQPGGQTASPSPAPATSAPPAAAAAPTPAYGPGMGAGNGLAAVDPSMAKTNPSLYAFLSRVRDPAYQNTPANEARLGPTGWNAYDPYGGVGAISSADWAAGVRPENSGQTGPLRK